MEFQNETRKQPCTYIDVKGVKVKRSCIACGSTSNKFKAKGKKCIKCYSKINNEKHREKDYFKQYYLDHKPITNKQPEQPEQPEQQLI
jgi:hypothetical protein